MCILFTSTRDDLDDVLDLHVGEHDLVEQAEGVLLDLDVVLGLLPLLSDVDHNERHGDNKGGNVHSKHDVANLCIKKPLRKCNPNTERIIKYIKTIMT